MSPLEIKLPALSTSVSIGGDWLDKRNEILTQSKQFASIPNNETFQAATELLSAITKHSNALEKFRKETTDPYEEAKKAIKLASDKARDPLEQEKSRLKAILGEFAETQRKAAEAEQRRIALEQQKLAEQQVAAQQQAEELGVEVVAEAPAAPTPAPVIVPPKAFGAAISERVEFEIVNADEVPRAFCSVDERLINSYIRENRDAIKQHVKGGNASGLVKGVKFTIRTDVASR